MQENFELIKNKAKTELESVSSTKALAELKLKFVGKSGEITMLLRGMKDIPAEERSAFGKMVNDLKEEVTALFNEKENALKKAIDKPYFVSGYLKANELFREMKKNNCYFSVVVDEFGGTDGTVTVNDLLDELVGDIENADPEILQLENGTYEIECSVEVTKFEKTFNVDINTDSITISGWIIELLGKVPKKDFVFNYENLSFTVADRDEKKVIKVVVKQNDIEANSDK